MPMKNLFLSLKKLTNSLGLTRLETFVIIALFAVFPLGQLTRITLSPGVVIYAHDILIVVWLALKSRFLLAQLKSVQLRKLISQNKVASLFLIWGAAGMVVASIRYQDIVPFLFLGRILLYGTFALTLWRRFSEHTFLRSMLAISGTAYWWLALLQYVFIPDTRFLSAFGWDEHYYRMVGTLADPAFTGILGVLTLIVISSTKQLIPQWIRILTTLALITGVVLTYSRASYISLAITLLLLVAAETFRGVITKKQFGLGLISVFVVLGTYLIAPKPGGEGVNLLRTVTIKSRFFSASQALGSLSGYEWILGRGLFTKPTTQFSQDQLLTSHARMPDNIFVTLLSQTGAVGLLLGSYLLFKLVKYLWWKDRYLATALMAVLVHSQFNNTLLQPFVLLYLLLFFASLRV